MNYERTERWRKSVPEEAKNSSLASLARLRWVKMTTRYISWKPSFISNGTGLRYTHWFGGPKLDIKGFKAHNEEEINYNKPVIDQKKS